MAKNSNKDAECCKEHHHHEDVIKKLSTDIPGENVLADVAELFKVFGDTTRIRILYALYGREVCVCDISDALNMTQSAISHQLSILKRSKLVKARRDGKSIYYSLADEHVTTIIAMGIEHVEEE